MQRSSLLNPTVGTKLNLFAQKQHCFTSINKERHRLIKLIRKQAEIKNVIYPTTEKI